MSNMYKHVTCITSAHAQARWNMRTWLLQQSANQTNTNALVWTILNHIFSRGSRSSMVSESTWIAGSLFFGAEQRLIESAWAWDKTLPGKIHPPPAKAFPIRSVIKYENVNQTCFKDLLRTFTAIQPTCVISLCWLVTALHTAKVKHQIMALMLKILRRKQWKPSRNWTSHNITDIS